MAARERVGHPNIDGPAAQALPVDRMENEPGPAQRPDERRRDLHAPLDAHVANGVVALRLPKRQGKRPINAPVRVQQGQKGLLGKRNLLLVHHVPLT